MCVEGGFSQIQSQISMALNLASNTKSQLDLHLAIIPVAIFKNIATGMDIEYSY